MSSEHQISDADKLLLDLIKRVDANYRASRVMDIATLTFLVDLNLVTVEQVAQRIELIRAALGNQYESDDVKSRLRLAAGWLVEQNPLVQTERASWTPQVIEGCLRQKDDDPAQ